MTPLEGFAFKKTVISSDIHGIPYTLNKDENCILIEVENYKELANSIIELIVNKEKRTRLGISGYNIVNSELNSRTMVKKTLKIYETIVHNYQLGKDKWENQ